jgi:hypothetical protein
MARYQVTPTIVSASRIYLDARWDGLFVFVDDSPSHFLNGPAPQCPQDPLPTQLLLTHTTLQPTHTTKQAAVSSEAFCLDKWCLMTYLCLSATRQSKAVKSRGEPGPLICRPLHTPLCSSFQSRTWHCRPVCPHRAIEQGDCKRPSPWSLSRATGQGERRRLKL